MDENTIKKHGPMIAAVVAIVGGIYWLSRNSANGGGSSVNNTGYSVVNPPDNSAAQAAAASVQQSRLQLAAAGLDSVTSLTAQREKDTTDISLAHITADNNVQLATLESQRQTTLAQIGATNEDHARSAQLDAYKIQSDSSLAQQQNESATALAIQREQDNANAALNAQNTNVQNNAIRATTTAAKHHDTTQAVLQIVGIAAMIAFCYDQTGNAEANRRIYNHGGGTYHGGEITDANGPAFRTPNQPDVPYFRTWGR